MSLFEALGGYIRPEEYIQLDFTPGRYKLTNEDATEIRRLYATQGWTQKGLAAEFGVSQPQISKIVNNKQRRQP